MSQTITTRGAEGPVAASRSRSWQRRIGHLAAVVLGTVLLVAAWAKLVHPAGFAETIRAKGLDFALPASAVALIAIALEVALGFSLVLGLRRRWILWPTAALVAFFVFLTGRAYFRFLAGTLPDDAGCGCFGNLVERTPAEAFWQDLALLIPPLGLAFLGAPRGGAAPRVRLAWVAVLTLAAVLFTVKAPGLPLDNLATRLKPGVSVGDLCAGLDDERTCLDAVVPDLTVGEHLVLLTGLDEPVFLAALEALNERHWSEAEPPLWVVSAASEDQRFSFRFTRAPAFDVTVAPTAVLAPLYRTLPRAFRVRDGEVTETWSGMPPGIAGTMKATAPEG